MKMTDEIKIFGDINFRGVCPSEANEQMTFFQLLRQNYPKTLGLLAIHPKNEGKRTYLQAAKDKAMGLTPGASDIIIPGNPCFVCELKRQDHTQSAWSTGQQDYLLAAKKSGAFVCVAFGYIAALQAVKEWQNNDN